MTSKTEQIKRGQEAFNTLLDKVMKHMKLRKI